MANVKIQKIAEGLKNFHRYCTFYPSTEQGLKAINDAKKYAPKCDYIPQYKLLEGEHLLDPWERPIFYEYKNGKIHLWSYGADKIKGGEGEDADIYFMREVGK